MTHSEKKSVEKTWTGLILWLPLLDMHL